MKAFSVKISFSSAKQGDETENHHSDEVTGTTGTSEFFDPGPTPEPLPAYICN